MTQAEIREEARKRWNELLSEAETSGLTIKEWCKNKGIEESTFYYRKRQKKLQEQNKDKAYSEGKKNRPVPCFAELNIALEKEDNHEGSERKRRIQEAEFLIQYEGCQIAIGKGFSEEDLRKIMRVLGHV